MVCGSTGICDGCPSTDFLFTIIIIIVVVVVVVVVVIIIIIIVTIFPLITASPYGQNRVDDILTVRSEKRQLYYDRTVIIVTP